MASNTYKTYLMLGKGEGSNLTYEKLIDIKDYPDLGGSPEMLETTTLSDPMQTHIPGIQNNDSMDFISNYVKADYDKVKALEGKEQHLAVYFGEKGEDGKFTFDGYVSAKVNGAGVNAVREMTTTVAASTPITVA